LHEDWAADGAEQAPKAEPFEMGEMLRALLEKCTHLVLDPASFGLHPVYRTKTIEVEEACRLNENDEL